ECDCGPKGTCSFTNGDKTCNCETAFLVKDGKCTECDCGSNGACSFQNGEKTCNCKIGFLLKDWKCTECDCGPEGVCNFKNGEKTCNCYRGFLLKEGKCAECDCGPNGICIFENDKKICNCKTGFLFKDGKCTAKNTCDDENPCKNGGTCEPKGEMDYECKCLQGFSGQNCEIIHWCKEICGFTPCQYYEDRSSGFCLCKDGLYFDAKVKRCKELDKCIFQRIKGNCSGDHETCDEKGNCQCEENYVYNDDRSACKEDFCWKKSNKSRCKINMECIEEVENFSCSCKEDYRQIGEICVKADKCAPGLSHCQQICNAGKCRCFNGFSLNKDGYSCSTTTPHLACSLDCGKGSCVKKGTKEVCICPEISHVFREKNCIDRCKAKILKHGECPKEVGCVSDENYGYRCNCTGKYAFAKDEVHCRAKRMCSEGYGNEDCSLRGGLCEDNFALTNGYKCKCEFGYIENPKTNVCEHMCETADCGKKQALCIINVDNNVECICPPLLVKDASGACNLLAKYSYIGDLSVPKKKYQVVIAEERGRATYGKLLKDFTDAMNNIFEGYEGTSILNCTDEGNDWKCFLEMKMNKDPHGKIDIISTPSVCLPFSDDLYCLIPPEFVTRKRRVDGAKVFHKTDPCDKGVIEKLCGKETTCKVSELGLTCKCKSGYFKIISFVPVKNVEVDVCEDVDECRNSTICPNTTTCSNLPGDYTCRCIDGYSLEEGKSVKRDGCTRIILKGDKATEIVGGTLGIFLVVTIIVCIILFRRLQKQNSVDDAE
ncbi:unnamed protein product, partial [Larinioides sclopetarius]